MKNHRIYQKALQTNKLTKQEAIEFFNDLYKETDLYIRKNFPSYVQKNRWPMKASVISGAEKHPQFILNHHTSNRQRQHAPALHRFLQSEKASSNFLVCDDGTILYLAKLDDMTYHATKRSFLPLSVQRALKVDDGKWINECGIETVGNGNVKLFSPEQFEALIVLQRLIVAYFDYSIKELKSHRFFSPILRAGDPGPTYLLPLIEYSIFEDYYIHEEETWLDFYTHDEVYFMNEQSVKTIERLGLIERDEWFDKRKKLKVDIKWLL